MFTKEMIYISSLMLIFTVMVTIGCSAPVQSNIINNNPNNQQESTNSMSQKKSSVDSRLVTANTNFGFKLYSKITKRNAGKNIFVSPSSILFALAMAYNGADGATKQAMQNALELQNLKLDEINAANAQLKSALETADPKVQIQIANSLWARLGAKFNPEFVAANKNYYQAEVRELDFNNASAPATINSWVNDKTRGKIDKIVDQIDRDILLFLINAIYFKGDWSVKFDPAKTKEGNFTLASGKQKRVPMMWQSGNFEYLENDKVQAIALPYGNRRLSMMVFLPKSNSSLAQFHQMLTAETWQSWMIGWRSREGSISLPRFKSEYEIELNDALSALGMGEAFQDRANFSKMFQPPQQVAISQVKHKAIVEVNEEGTVAAAVTSIQMRTTSLGPPPFQMVVDRPFFFAIRDKESGAILFMGSIAEP
jgi:serpin B